MEAEIRELLQESGVSFKTNSKSFIMSCPRCKKKDKLYIRRADGRFVCWYCKEIDSFQGQPEFALTELCGISLKDIRTRLFGNSDRRAAIVYLDIRIGDFGDEDEFIDIAPKLPSYAWPLDFFPIDHECSKAGLEYLVGRGVPKEIAIEYSIRYQPAKQRVIFPVMDHGDLLGWQARLVANDQPYWDEAQFKMVTPLKILTSTDLKRDRCFMFSDRLQGSEHCILTEGPIDALKAHLCGGNVASMGKAVSNNQLELIRNAGVSKLYLGLDPDAYLEINRIRRKMTDLVIYDLRPPAPYKDLGEMSMLAVKQLFDNAPVLNPADVVIYLKQLFGAP